MDSLSYQLFWTSAKSMNFDRKWLWEESQWMEKSHGFLSCKRTKTCHQRYQFKEISQRPCYISYTSSAKVVDIIKKKKKDKNKKQKNTMIWLAHEGYTKFVLDEANNHKLRVVLGCSKPTLFNILIKSQRDKHK